MKKFFHRSFILTQIHCSKTKSSSVNGISDSASVATMATNDTTAEQSPKVLMNGDVLEEIKVVPDPMGKQE